MSTCQLHNCVVGNAICSGARKVAGSVGQALSSFAMPLWTCAVVLLSVSLPVHGASVFTGSDDTTDTLPDSNDVCVFTETLLFPKASSAVIRDFARNGAAIDSIHRFFSVTDTRNLVDIKVTGSYSPEGDNAFNINLAEARARALGSLVRAIDHSINPKLSIGHPAARRTDDYRTLRNAELQVVYHNIASAREMPPHDTVCRPGVADATGICDNIMEEPCVSDTTCLPPPCRYNRLHTR